MVKITSMEISDIFNILHNAVEAKNFGKKISQKEMSERLGLSMRTYQDWKLGNAKPQAAETVFRLLGELEDEDILRVVKKIKKGIEENA